MYVCMYSQDWSLTTNSEGHPLLLVGTPMRLQMKKPSTYIDEQLYVQYYEEGTTRKGVCT